MENLFARYSVAQLEAMAVQARRAQMTHEAGGRAYFASLCEDRVRDVAREIHRREAAA